MTSAVPLPVPAVHSSMAVKQLTLGVEFNYLIEWAIDLSYTNYMGGGSYNLSNDRDFIAASVRYSF